MNSPRGNAGRERFVPDEELGKLERQLESLVADDASEKLIREVLNAVNARHRELGRGGMLSSGDIVSQRYILAKCVGSGGFGTVWKAFDRELKRFVALKVLHPHHHYDKSPLARFFRGARQMLKLTHPNIVRVLKERGQDGIHLYFVMEFIAGENFYRTVVSGRSKREGLLDVIEQIGGALTFAHDRGIVHRDVKPGNILIDENGKAQLTDFDLVRAEDTNGLTHTGAIGSFVYAAPESMVSGKEADAQSDLCSLGITTVFALYGRDLPMAVVKDAPSLIASLDCNDRLKDVLEKSVEWDRSKRYASVAEFIKELRKATKTVTPVVINDLPRDGPPVSFLHRTVPAGAGSLEPHDWEVLLDAIENHECTPVLGAGVCAGRLPSFSELALQLATETGYPLADSDDLARVSQFVAERIGPVAAKREVLKMLGLSPIGQDYRQLDPPPNDDPHSFLAQLPLKLYITTNYDDFMFRALQQYRPRADRRHCRWYTPPKAMDVDERLARGLPSVERPLVFHLYGCNDEPLSLVVTENDRLDFMLSIGRNLNAVPPVIQGAIAQSSLLFIGYGLGDWDFRVLHRGLLSHVVQSQRWPHFIVQLTPFEYESGCVATLYMKNGDKITGTVISGDADHCKLKSGAVGTIPINLESVRHVQVVDPGGRHLAAIEDVKCYLTEYLGRMDMRVYWGTANQFVHELWRRWSTRRKRNG